MRRLHAILLFAVLIAVFTFSTLSYFVNASHASSPPGTCWQDKCDGTFPLQNSCGTPFRAQLDIPINDPYTQTLLGQLRMWKTGASGSGCMDIWATFAGNGNESGQYTFTIEINRTENINPDRDGFPQFWDYTGGNGNHDSPVLG